MEIQRKNEILSKVYSDSQNIISLADSKANTSLTIQSLLLTIGLGFSILSNTFQKLKILIDFNIVFVVFYIIIILLFIGFSTIGIITTILVFKPREAIEISEKERKGLFYFKHVLDYKSSEEYFLKIKKLNEDELLEEYSKQIFQLSYIANEKFKFVNFSIIFLVINIGLAIIFLILSGILNIFI